MKIVTRIGRLSDPRIKRTPAGYKADGVTGTFTTWIAAFEAMSDSIARTALSKGEGE